MNESRYLPVQWPEKYKAQLGNVHAVTTLRAQGQSVGDFSSFNLATHVDDNPASVLNNRTILSDELGLSSEPVWLEQVHSNCVVNAEDKTLLTADASFTRSRGVVCAVLTADCLPVFLCSKSATEVAVAHAGWRGLHAGIISNTVKAMQASADEILVSLGPAIGPLSFEVGEEVFRAFVDSDAENERAFTSTVNGHYLCDLYQLARIELQSLGITDVTGGEHCTYRDNQRFYSFRRQSRTGRMASLIWLE